MQPRTDITTEGMIAIGRSAGGFASIALAADPPPGLAAVINFAGGRGSRADDDVCDEDALVRAFGAWARPRACRCCGSTQRTTSTSGRNWRTASTPRSSGRRPCEIRRRAAVRPRRPFAVFATGASIWIPMVDGFLREQNLGFARADCSTRHGGACRRRRQLSERGRGSFAGYLPAARTRLLRCRRRATSPGARTCEVGARQRPRQLPMRKICAGLRALCGRR